MVKKWMAMLSVGVVAALCGCATSENAPAPSPTVSESTVAATLEAEPAEAHPFGDTVRLDVAGSVWEVQIGEPRDVAADIAAHYEGTGLEPNLEDGYAYVGIPGTVTRVGDGPSDPFPQISVSVIVDNRTIDAYLGYVGVDGLTDVGELFPGGQAEFTQLFELPEGTDVRTVSVIGKTLAGAPEPTKVRYIFGEPVDLGSAGEEPSTTPTIGIGQVMAGWLRATEEQRAQSFEAWGLASGEVTDVEIEKFIDDSRANGAEFTETEAREFLEWVLTQ